MTPLIPLPDPDDEGGTVFEPYDICMLVGYALIAWASCISIGMAIATS